MIASGDTALPPTVIDDFEDGDSADWVFFGGNNAGGGGGVLDDRPYEGVFYFSTGWGGQGTASGFYGGAFRNLDNAAQVALPADPWFNVWVLNQSNATVDQYILEITLREDTDGDGWTNGAEDSIRLDAIFASAEFNDEWVQIDGEATVIDMPDAADALVEYYRCISGEHPDWDEYRQAMRDQGKSVIVIRPTRWGPVSKGGFPPELFED